MDGASKVGIGIALGLSAALGVAAWTAEPRIAPAIDRDAAQALAVGDLRAEWAGLHTRTATLAQLPRLAAAIATDAATVRDLTSEELSFRVHPGETIELAQRDASGLHSLLRLPPDAAPSSLVLGTAIAADGDDLVFRDTVPIVGTQANGAIAIAWRARPAVVFSGVGARTNARIVVGGHTFAIGTPIANDAPIVVVPLAGDDGDGVIVELPAIRETTMAAIAFRIGTLAALLAALAIAVGTALAQRRRRRAGQPVGIVPTSLPPIALPIVIPQPAAGGTGGIGGVPSLAVRLGRYEIDTLLGAGGTASVYLAHAHGDEGFAKRVALKVLRADLTHDDQFREMFLDEARLASQIEHPNVVQILDLGRAGDELYIAMEHIDGGDLEGVLTRQRTAGRLTPLPIALTILRRLCEGLHAAHTAVDRGGAPLDLVHRDVKPGNVMISRNGEVKIGDFGIAKATQQQHRTMLGETKGTVQFMAPEQRMGRAVDPRTDVFGVAAVGYELITGVELDLDLQRLLKYGLEGWPHLAAVRAVRPDAPVELEPILFAALAYHADARPATCALLEQQLAGVMTAHGWSVASNELAQWMRDELELRTAPALPTRASA